jgi:hypothetical protein
MLKRFASAVTKIPSRLIIVGAIGTWFTALPWLVDTGRDVGYAIQKQLPGSMLGISHFVTVVTRNKILF